MKHASLSPSSAERWLKCPPSVRLSEQFKEETSEYAMEGTSCHSLCEHLLKQKLGRESIDPREDLTYYNEEMEECAEGYANYVMEIVRRYERPMVFIEERLDLSKYVKDTFGTADCIVLGDSELHIIDYKHGQGVLVDANNNPQLMLYGLGGLYLFDDIYNIRRVFLHIYQPRRENVSVFEISTQALYKWKDEELIPKASLALKGEGEFQAGGWCRFCKARSVCAKRAEKALEIAREEFKRPELLSDEEIEEALGIIDDLTAWIKDIKTYAVDRALKGKRWQRYKLVEGRSNRRYVDEELVARRVSELGFNPYEEKLLGITAMTKLLGKSKFEELLQDLLEKPKGKITLVNRSDRREEVSIDNVKDEFTKIEMEA